LVRFYVIINSRKKKKKANNNKPLPPRKTPTEIIKRGIEFFYEILIWCMQL
jgi:hypothetical protein